MRTIIINSKQTNKQYTSRVSRVIIRQVERNVYYLATSINLQVDNKDA